MQTGKGEPTGNQSLGEPSCESQGVCEHRGSSFFHFPRSPAKPRSTDSREADQGVEPQGLSSNSSQHAGRGGHDEEAAVDCRAQQVGRAPTSSLDSSRAETTSDRASAGAGPEPGQEQGGAGGRRNDSGRVGDGDQPQEAEEGAADCPVPGPHGHPAVRSRDHSTAGKASSGLGDREHGADSLGLCRLWEACCGDVCSGGRGQGLSKKAGEVAHQEPSGQEPEQELCEGGQSHRKLNRVPGDQHPAGTHEGGQAAPGGGLHHEGQGGAPPEGGAPSRCSDVKFGRDGWQLQGGEPEPIEDPALSGDEKPDPVFRKLSSEMASHIEKLSGDIVPGLFQGLVSSGRPVVMEVACHPDSLIGQAVQDCTGDSSSCSRVSVWNGGDLATSAGIKLVLERVRRERPLNIWIATPCGPYSPLQRTNCRNPDQIAELEKKRAWARRVYVGAAVVARFAAQHGSHVTWEWSEKCEAWRFPWIQKMVKDLDLKFAVTHGCRVGLRSDKDRKLLRKGWKVATTHSRLADYLQCTCQCGPHYQHGRCQGKDAEASARYTPEYAKRVAKIMCQELSHQQAISECQGKSTLPVMFGVGGVCQCEEPCFQKQQQQCGQCVCPEPEPEATETRQAGDPEIGEVFETAEPPEMEAANWNQREMEEAEGLARELRKKQRFDFSSCEQLIRLLPKSTKPGRPGARTDQEGRYDVFGAYVYGSQQGVTRRTRELPECTRYLNMFMSFQCGKKYRWTSFAINHNRELKAHRDVNNNEDQPNIAIGMGSYQGGGIWVQENIQSKERGWDQSKDKDLVVRDTGTGGQLWGRVYQTKHQAVVFPPKAWHKTEPWTGDRLIISAYSSRASHRLPEAEQDLLRSTGFPLPPTPGAAWMVGTETDRRRETDRINRQLYLLHAATGHCSTRHLVDALKRRGARPEVIKLAEEFRCSICEEKKRIQPRHVASLEPLPPKFHTISADVGHFYHEGKKEHVQFLLIIDEGSRFRVAKVVSRGQKQQPSGATCVQYIQEGWSQIFGQPRTLRLDPAGSFRSQAVEQFCDRHGIYLDIVPGEAHWKIGVCEQAVQGVKSLMEKLVMSEQENEPEEALATAVRTFNQRDMIRGFSPVQHVLGQAPDETGRSNVGSHNIPPELLVENPSGEFQRAVLRRQEAEKALADWTARQRLVRAQNSRSRECTVYQPGDLVFFWRAQEAGRQRQGLSHKRGRFAGPARILAMESKRGAEGGVEASSSVWLVRGRSLIKVSAEQLRAASPREELLEAVSSDNPTPWTFHRVAEQIGGNQFEDLSQQRPSEEEWLRAQDPREEVQPSRREPHAPVQHRYRGKRPVSQPAPSDDEELIPAEPSSSSRRRVGYDETGRRSGAYLDRLVEEQKGERWTDHVHETAWFNTEPSFWKDDHACVEVEVEMPSSHRGWRQAAGNLECYLISAMKRKAVEVSEKHMSEADKEKFRAAKSVEVKNFIAARAFESLPDHLKPSREKALGMRWCLTWKLKDTGEVKAKARAVLLGYQDPCYEHRATTAPVMTRQSRQMILQQAARRNWTVYKGGVSGAFLQGEEYPGTLHVIPTEEICRAMDIAPGSITLLKKACYGLVEAPLQWYRSVHKFLTEIGLERTWSDSCTWVWRPNGVLRGQVSSHVDDFMFAGGDQDSGWQDILRRIKERFQWGDWERDDFIQCGVRIQRVANGFTLSQEKYIEGLQEIPLSTSRRRARKEDTSEREKTQLRALLGGLSWVAQQTAPHLSAEVSLLLSEVGKSTVETIIKTNILLSHTKARKGHQMLIHKFSFQEELSMYVWVDAGSQNRPDGGSTQGIFVGIGPAALQAGELGKISPIAWHSSKIDRACRSPGAAEAQAAVNGEDCLFFARYQWSELEHGEVDPRDAVRTVRQTEGCLVTDSRNVYDKLREEVLVIKGAEKRTSIELIGLKESQWSTDLRIRWVHSEAQLANGLTKSQGGKEIELFYQMGTRLEDRGGPANAVGKTTTF